MFIPVISLKGLPKPWPAFVYVGRAMPSFPELEAHPLANPFKLLKDTTRDRIDCLEQYRCWLKSHPDRDRLLWELYGDCEAGRMPLACWCANWNGWQEFSRPLCHAAVLAEVLVAQYGPTCKPYEG
jgi:hypothetical protein